MKLLITMIFVIACGVLMFLNISALFKGGNFYNVLSLVTAAATMVFSLLTYLNGPGE